MKEWCRYQCRDLKNTRDPEDIAKAMMKSLLSTRNVLYLHLPGVDDDQWSEKELADYRRKTGDKDSEPWTYTARLEIEGTTFSGLSTRTTLGNTLRSIAYIFYYAVCAGIGDPWKSGSMSVIASGDDTVAWIRPELADDLVESILEHTARSGEEHSSVGLG